MMHFLTEEATYLRRFLGMTGTDAVVFLELQTDDQQVSKGLTSDYDDFVQRERSKLYPKTVINNQTAEQGHTNCIMLCFTEVTNGSKAT